MGIPIIGKSCNLEQNRKTDFVTAVGNNKMRKKRFESYGVRWVTLIHPSAQIGVKVSISSLTYERSWSMTMC